jgi:hypothetical protein
MMTCLLATPAPLCLTDAVLLPTVVALLQEF